MKPLKLAYVYNRKRRLNKDGSALIQMRCHYNCRTAYCGTGIYVTPAQWDQGRQKVKGHPLAINYNVHLTNLNHRAQLFYLEKITQNAYFTAADICAHVSRQDQKDFIRFSRRIIEEERTAGSTKKQRLTLINYLESYSEKIYFGQISGQFINKFERFLAKQKNQRTGDPLSMNYIASMLTMLRRFTNQALGEGHIKQDPFLNFSIKREKRKKNALTLAELELLARHKMHRRGKWQVSKDAFLFSAYTGLRFSDIFEVNQDPKSGLRAKNISSNRLKITPYKTRKHKIEVNLPLNLLFGGQPMRIIKPYLKGKAGNDLLFGRIHNKSYNEHIKAWIKAAGIDKNIKGHQARDSFTSNLQAAGVPLKIASILAGHTSVKTTEGYTNLDPEVIDSFLQ